MDNAPDSAVTDAGLYRNGLIITFADGRFAYYAASLLRGIFEQAEEMFGEADDDLADLDRPTTAVDRRSRA